MFIEVMIDRLDICVVTYERLEYLKRCIWSIIMTTKVPFRLFVLSDHSTDDTNEWLKEMKEHGKIHEIIINKENEGAARSFNKIIRASDSEWFVTSCDDMYFYRGWDDMVVNIAKEFEDCGMVSFWDYPAGGDYIKKKAINEHVYIRQKTGLACTLMYRPLFDMVGGYKLPEGIKMGYFAKDFCDGATHLWRKGAIKRWKQYITILDYAVQMDREKEYSQNYLYWDYTLRRNKEKSKFKEYQRKHR